MKRLVLSVTCLVALVATTAAAGERETLLRLERALERAERAGAGTRDEAELRGLLAELESEGARHRRVLEAAGAKRLPPKARERLRRARAAYEEGHGELIEAVRGLAGGETAGARSRPSPSGSRTPARPLRASDALARLRKIEAASRRPPLSGPLLNVRVPEVVGTRDTSTAAEPEQAGLGGGSPIGQIPQLLKDAAAQLAGPVEVYDYVRESIRPEYYHGAMKGPVQTYLEQAGNDADTASLLIMLLRAKGFEARYVRAQALVSAKALVAHTGTGSVEQAVRVLERAGIPHETVIGAGGVSSVKWERTWVEAYIPYVNYRGAQLDAQGKQWVPLDAAFKPLAPPAGFDVADQLGFAAASARDAYLESADRRRPVEFVRERVTQLLAAQRPGTPYQDALNRRNHVAESLGLLPSTLPYALTSPPEPSYELPAALGHTLRVVGEADGVRILDATLEIASLLGRRLTLSYVPFANEDALVVRQYGSIQQTPPFLIEVRPVLKAGGIPVATGNGAVGMAVRYTLRLEFQSPRATETITNAVLAGNLIALGLGGRRVTGGEAKESVAAEILSARAWSYLNRWNESDEELADLLRVVPVRPLVSACLVFSDVVSDYAGGDPLYPLSFDWKGIAIDADLRSTAPVGVETRAREKDFLLLSGLEGSVLENRIFEDDLGIESVSTAKALQLAVEQGTPILDLDGATAAPVLAGLPLDPAVKADIEAALARGLRVRVPAANVTRLAWTGVGYLHMDDETGETGWQLQGGHSGGVTAPAVSDFPAQVSDPLIRQREDEPPSDVIVAKIERFLSRDFQFGVVDKPLSAPLKVLVTDADGFAVKGAQVTFQVLGGGGSLLDPAGVPAGDVTRVFSNERGEAEAGLVLGKLTGEIPRFFLEEGDTYATQVGLNLVSAYAGGVAVDEPFSAFGRPDDRFDGTRHADIKWQSITRMTLNGRLEAAGNMNVAVTDQHGNPISNVPVVFRYVAPPEQSTPPPGWHHMSGPTMTPGTLLSRADYRSCVQTNPHPITGDCPGEGQLVIDLSSAIGAGATVLPGDSSFSIYRYKAGTAATPDILSAAFGTGGYLCSDVPSATTCLGDPKLPDPAIINQGHRPVLVNESGLNIEAYPPGASARIELWASALYEDAIADEVVVDGVTRYRARGLGKWTRRRLTNSEFGLQPLTPGTAAAPETVAYDGTGYRGSMTMGGSPQLNTVRYTGRHKSDVIRYLSDRFSDGMRMLDPQYVDPITKQITRLPADQPYQEEGQFELWGVIAQLQGPEPAPIVTTPSGSVAEESKLRPAIQPAEYVQRLAPRNVLLDVSRVDLPPDGQGEPVKTPVLNGAGKGDFTIPAGLSLPPADYEALMWLPGVSFATTLPQTSKDILAPSVAVSTCRLVSLQSPVVELMLVRDTVNNTTCGNEEPFFFTLCRDSFVTLTVDGQVVTAPVDDSGIPRALSDYPLQAGTHRVLLRSDLLGETLTEAPLVVRAVAMANGALTDQDTGRVRNALASKSSLPVGHTFVKGVDLFDGHVVQQATDLRARGRHLGLEVTRTYSSAGRETEGLLGAGWSFNYESYVLAASCAVVVRTADGGSQVFTPLGGDQYRPQKGYHTKLVKNAGDGSFDFTDKAGVVHHFREPQDPAKPFGPRRLDWIRDPHSDELRFRYDGENRLEQVAEWHPERGETRRLAIAYLPEKDRKQGFDRIRSLEIQPHGITATYGYDAFGNLTSASTSTGLDWTYSYTATLEAADRHQLLSVMDPNGARTEYEYFGENDAFPGETSGGMPPLGKREFAKLVREFADKALAQPVPTQYSYDYTDWQSSRYRATVRDANGHETVYTLNGNGSPLEIAEPEGRTTKLAWATDDVLKLSETDALQRVTAYDYDDRGNLTLERIQAPGIGAVETVYAYDARFNKLTLKRDALGRETRYTIDPDTGDLTLMRDAVGNETVYDYDDRGQLLTVRDPRGNLTTHREHNEYGDPGETEDALGNVTTRTFDARGRLRTETDTMGRSKTLDYDEQDRVTSQLRRSGGPAGNADEVTETEHYPLGQVKKQTNANGGQTSYELDAMNRVTRTITPSGTIVTDWNGDGTKRAELDRRGVGRNFEYDGVHRLKKVTIAAGLPGEAPTGEVAYFEWDKVGNKTLERDHAKRVTRYEYDGLYRVKTKVLPQAPYDEKYSYDKVGNRLQAFDANGNETRYEYDGLNRQTKVRRDPEGLNLTVVTEYDDPGGSHVNKSAEHDVTRGLRTEFLYDALNRESERKVLLLGEDGDPAANPGPYVTATTYQDATHSMTVLDARGNETEVKMDGLDRPIERTQKDVYADGRDLVTQSFYDGLGNKVKEIDPEGREKSWFYDEQGRLKSATDFAGTMAYDYDGEGLKTSETDRRQVQRAFTYDNLARPRTERFATTQYSGVPWSREIRYDDTVNAWKRREKDARGNETVFHLDGLERVTKVVDPDNKFTETAWDGVNRRAERDKRGNTTSFEYDAVNRLTKTRDPAPFQTQTVVTTYDDANNRKTDKDRRGFETVTQTDALGRTVTGTRSGVRLEKHAYDPNSNRTSSEDAEGKRTAFVYDPANRLTSRTDGVGTPEEATTRFVVDGSGNKLKEIDPRSTEAEPSMRYEYDGANRLTDTFDGEGNHTRHVLDGEGNRTELHEPEGQVTGYAYDELGKLKQVTQPATGDHPAPVTEYRYDENRNRIRQTDARGNVVEMGYDKLNRLDKMTQKGAPEGDLVTDHDYDENGNETKVTDPKGQVVTNGYDELNRLKTRTYQALPADLPSLWWHIKQVGYVYDENGNLRQVDEQVASGTDPPNTTLTTTRTYDSLDRLETETQPLPDGGSRTVSYTYFGNGTRKSVTDPENRITEYSYDGQNRLQTATTEFGTPQASTTAHTYLPDDLLDEVRYPNGTVAKHSYDKVDRLLSVVNSRAAVILSSFLYFGADPVSGATVSYDRNGNRLIQVETNGGLVETTRYGYDALNRLKTIAYPADSTFPSGRSVVYGYDAVGNRQTEAITDPVSGTPLNSKAASFDALNRLTSVTDSVIGETTGFTYDRNGNQTTKTVTTSAGSTTTTNLYDSRDKLVEVQQGSSILSRFQYCYDGKRIKKIGLEGIRQYFYDDDSLFMEFDDLGASVAKYDYGSDRLISLFRRDEPRRFFHLDGLRSVTNLTDDAGGVVSSVHYDAWGLPRFPAELDASKNRFGFTGYELDKETGLYNANARFYDPTTARFTTQDSFLGSIDQPPSLHRYAYGWNRPTFWIDRTGHAPGDWWDVRSYDWRVAGRTAWQQTGRIGGAAYNTVVATARETPRVIADAGVLGFEAATGFDTGYGLRSQTARSAGQRMAAGEWVGDVTQDTALGIVKGVTNAQVVEDQLKAYADYRTGRATLDEFENRMSGAAGSGLANAALAKGAHAWYRAATAKVVVESATQAPHEPIANITPEAAALAELASGAPDGTFGIANAAPAAVPAAAIGRAPKSGVICGSGGPCKVYEIPAEQLAAGKPYIGKTRRAIPERMADADHRLKTATGKPPQAQPLAENLTPEEAAGLEALLAQERGLGNLSNKIPPLDPSLPKNAARLEAARKLLKARQQ